MNDEMAEDLRVENQRLRAELGESQAELEETQKELAALELAFKRKEIELQAVIAKADEVSYMDALTGLPNGHQVMKDLQDEVIRAERYKTFLSISMIDIDHFKKVNDTYGHPDKVGRYGGEEFLVVIPNTHLNQAAGQAARLCNCIRETEMDVGHLIRVTISIGTAEYKHGQENWQEFLNRADKALYAAKNAGRDRWMISE